MINKVLLQNTQNIQLIGGENEMMLLNI